MYSAETTTIEIWQNLVTSALTKIWLKSSE